MPWFIVSLLISCIIFHITLTRFPRSYVKKKTILQLYILERQNIRQPIVGHDWAYSKIKNKIKKETTTFSRTIKSYVKSITTKPLGFI